MRRDCAVSPPETLKFPGPLSMRVYKDVNVQVKERSECQRTPWGGGTKGGGWKTSRMTRLPKRGFGPPPRTVPSPPPSGVEALLEGSKSFRESAFSGTFSSPHMSCTPPYHGPRVWARRTLYPSPTFPTPTFSDIGKGRLRQHTLVF